MKRNTQILWEFSRASTRELKIRNSKTSLLGTNDKETVISPAGEEQRGKQAHCELTTKTQLHGCPYMSTLFVHSAGELGFLNNWLEGDPAVTNQTSLTCHSQMFGQLHGDKSNI